jgi:hypothetical protein
MMTIPPELQPRSTPDAQVISLEPGAWRLTLPLGAAGRYRLAQIDDYRDLPREDYPWHPPLCLRLQARASSAYIPGTWGFGLWNDPFGAGLRGAGLRLPALPETAWFFFASPENYLSLRDDLPANGALAATFNSRQMSSSLMVRAGLALSAPLAVLPAGRRVMRRLARRLVQQDAAALALDPTEWHTYEMAWMGDRVIFKVDEEIVLESDVSPRPPLARVLWVDNQFAAFTPDGALRAGTLENRDEAWVEVVTLNR